MLRLLPSEKFKEIEVPPRLRLRYAISTHGRMVSYKDDILSGRLLANSKSDGYPIFRYHNGNKIPGKSNHTMMFIYRLVAQHFVPKPSEEHQYIIHLDHSRDNDHHTNLQWATRDEKIAHYKKSPRVIAAKQKLLEFNIKRDGRKLTVTQVIRLKKQILDPNRKTRLRILAKQFGISEMQLYRIKSGENWGHIKV